MAHSSHPATKLLKLPMASPPHPQQVMETSNHQQSRPPRKKKQKSHSYQWCNRKKENSKNSKMAMLQVKPATEWLKVLKRWNMRNRLPMHLVRTQMICMMMIRLFSFQLRSLRCLLNKQSKAKCHFWKVENLEQMKLILILKKASQMEWKTLSTMHLVLDRIGPLKSINLVFSRK